MTAVTAARTPGETLRSSGAFTLDALIALARRFPAAAVEKHAAAIPLVHPSGRVKRIDEPVDAIVAGAAGEPWWVMLSGLEAVEPYGRLAVELSEPWHSGRDPVMARVATAFISSPGSVVPWHIDVQHNLLVQVDGTKEVLIGAISDEDVARCILSGVRNMTTEPAQQQAFVLAPGDAIYIPPRTAHAVVGTEAMSVSFSSMWVTRRSDDERLAHYVNARLHTPRSRRLIPVKAAAARLHWRLTHR